MISIYALIPFLVATPILSEIVSILEREVGKNMAMSQNGTNNINIYDDKYFKLGARFTLPSKLVLQDIMREYREDVEGIKVMEIGCGSGDLLKTLQEKGADVFGVEVSESAIVFCKDKGIRCEKADLSCIQIEESKMVTAGAFDMCIFVEVLEHIFDYFRLLSNINRSLKLRGQVFFTTPNFNDIRRLVSYVRGKSCSQMQNIGHIRFFSKDYLKKVFTIEGFAIELKTGPTVELLSNVSPHGVLSWMFQEVSRPLILGKATKVGDAQISSIYDISPPGRHRQIIESLWKKQTVKS